MRTVVEKYKGNPVFDRFWSLRKAFVRRPRPKPVPDDFRLVMQELFGDDWHGELHKLCAIIGVDGASKLLGWNAKAINYALRFYG